MVNGNFIRKALPFAVLGVLMTPTVAFASTGTQVQGGSLLINDGSSSSLAAGTTAAGSTQGSSINSFSSTTINMASGLAAATGNEYIRVDDNTGTLDGWDATVSATDLIAQGITDPTASGATLTVTIPMSTNILTVTPSALTAVVGSSTGVNQGSGAEQVTGTASGVLSADQGYGGGAYTEQLAYDLQLPTTIPASDIVSTSSSSAFAPGNTRTDSQSVLAGNYSTTISYGINSAP